MADTPTDWPGQAVSISCDDKLGVFQGVIKSITASHLTIIRAFRNGVPLRKQDAEVTLRGTDIKEIRVINMYKGVYSVPTKLTNKPTPVKQPNFSLAGTFADKRGGGGAEDGAAAAGGNSAGGAGAGSSRSFASAGGNYNNAAAASSSTLSTRIQNMTISAGGAAPANGIRSTPNNSRASNANAGTGSNNGGGSSNRSSPPNSSASSSVAQFFGNLIPPKVEVRMGAALGGGVSGGSGAISRPIDIIDNFRANSGAGDGTYFGQSNGSGRMRNNGAGNDGRGFGGGSAENSHNQTVSGGGNQRSSKKQQRNKQNRDNNLRHNQTFGTSVDDPQLYEDFDFEGNLALFDKRAIWDSIEENQQQPDLLQQARPGSKKNKKYRHDENILESEPAELRQIESRFEGTSDFVTDEGLIIPTIPTFVRAKIELSAEKSGLSLLRQVDILARGTTDLAILMLGGARRLTPNNVHQWPKITIVCQKSDNIRACNIGAATGRQLASHGLKVWLYLEETNAAAIEQMSPEIALFKATGNVVVYAVVNSLPTPDLVILSTNTVNLSGDVKKWLSENRASILAIDPPPCGIRDVSMKYAILPILPLNGISSNNCGKLYLCNLGIPDKFYREAGIKYKSPFGHKFVIPIHSKD